MRTDLIIEVLVGLISAIGLFGIMFAGSIGFLIFIEILNNYLD